MMDSDIAFVSWDFGGWKPVLRGVPLKVGDIWTAAAWDFNTASRKPLNVALVGGANSDRLQWLSVDDCTLYDLDELPIFLNSRTSANV